MLQKGTVEKKTFELLEQLMQESVLASTTLVGGTALALQIGHRKSTDLVLFTTQIPNIEEIVNTLRSKYGYIPSLQSDKTTIGQIDGIKIDVIYHPYKWIKPVNQIDDIRLASLEDIGAMKLHAIANSGERPKDFVDIAFLSKLYSYNTLKSFTLEKYPMYDPLMIDRSVIYFDDVNTEAIDRIKMIGFFMNWTKIQKRILCMTEKPDKIFLNPPLERKLPQKLNCKKKGGPKL